MICRRRVSALIRLLSLGVLTSLLLITPSTVCSDDFRILLVRDGDIDKERQLPTGEVVVKAGYLDGVEIGMTGTVWRKNKFKGQIDIANLEVTEVCAYEATCKYTVRHRDFFILKRDRAALDPVDHSEADILGQAVDCLGRDECFDALLLFENIFCATLNNAFVQAQIAECLNRVEQRLATGPPEDQQKQIGVMVWDYVELATRHHKYKNDLVADLYLKRIATLDSGNAKAAALRESVPVQDYATLLSPTQCSSLASNGSSSGDPAINEFVAVDLIAEMIHYESPGYPRLAEQAGLQGMVWIKALVGTDGRVKEAVIYKSSGTQILDQAALDVASKCKFKPAIKDGKPIAMWVTYKVEFILD